MPLHERRDGGEQPVLLGLARHGEATGRKHILSTAIEHKATLGACPRIRLSLT